MINIAKTENKSIIVNVDNFRRAETDIQFERGLKLTGGVNQWFHNRQPTPLETQNVIRMNRDTLYSSAIVDISQGASLTIPDAGDRYMLVMVVNQDHFVNRVYYVSGTYQLSVEEFDTPYVGIVARTFIDANNDEDIKAANKLQDMLTVKALSSRPFTIPNYDQESYNKTHKLLLELSRSVGDTFHTFGKKEEVDQVRHLLATAWGWGGLPVEDAFYENVEPNLPAKQYQITVKDVPVDAFWSITVYNKDGFLEKNELDVYSFNNITAKSNDDGSITIHFGGCEKDLINCIPIMEGWNYTVRMYRPREEILKGQYYFPKPEPVE